MVIGTPRREAVQDNLAGQDGMTPVTLPGPGLMRPAAPAIPDVQLNARIAGNLANWSGGKLKAAADVAHQKSTLDGQMAYQQGQAMDAVEMGGDKWALDGYKVMDAQTIASSLLGAQMSAIDQTDYALSPDQFREQYTARMDGILKGVDPRTADLVREQMTRQMGPLVQDHTVKHLTYKEGENYDSLVRSVDVISRDPTATGELLTFAAGGPGTASAGLSDERRQSAVVAGVVSAFENDNPLAYAALSSKGLLGDSLSPEQRAQIKGAKASFEGRRRTDYNETLFVGEQDLLAKVTSGSLDPMAAVEQLSVLYADHGITMNAADAGAIYSQADSANTDAKITRGVLIENAGLRGDIDTQASLIMDSLTGTESGGNPAAFRTNSDGRSFGGLIQMGQARLGEYAKATGTAEMTVVEFTALPASAQKQIGMWHVKDLISAAQQTGAIGSQINGVTVTLSGLVAVAHLGGAAGMRKFVESGGEYNPEDQLGTSLSEYLSKHGSGDGAVLKSASDRLAVARTMLENTKKAVNADAYRQTAFADAEADSRFKSGVSTRDEWLAERQRNSTAYGYARTEADTNHELGIIADVRTKASTDAERAHLDSATGEILDAQQSFKAVVDNPASTPEAVKAAMLELTNARTAIFDKYNIPQGSRGTSQYMKDSVGAWDKYVTAHKTWTGEQTDIELATQTGTLASLPPALQKRAFDAHIAEAQKTYGDAVAARKMDVGTANAAIVADSTAFFAKAGVVDKRVAAQMTAAMLGPMINKDGNPSPQMIDAVTQYMNLQTQNSRAADTMLTPEAQIIAEAVLARSPDPAMFGETIRTMGIDKAGNPNAQDSAAFMARDDVQAAITAQADLILSERDIGFFQTIFRGDTEWSQQYDTTRDAGIRMGSPETRAAISGELQMELANLQKQNPNLKPRDLAAMASRNVQKRVELVAGNVVVLNPGQDILGSMFGGRANDMQHPGVVNSAIMDWLRDPITRQQYGYLGGPVAGERIPKFLQGGIDSVLGVGRYFGADVGLQPGMGFADTNSYLETGGLRPMNAYATADGKGIAIEVLKADGNYSGAIVLPLAEIGAMYLKKHNSSLTSSPPPASPDQFVPSPHM